MPCDLALFADDIAMWPHRLGLQGDHDLQTSLDALVKWASRYKVAFNAAKSSTVILSTDTQINKLFFLNQTPIPVDTKFKYLGVIFQSDGEWDAHVASTCCKLEVIKDTIFTVSEYCNRLTTISHLIRTLLFPIISYGWPVWYPNAKQHTTLQNSYLSILRKTCHLSRHCLSLIHI